MSGQRQEHVVERRAAHGYLADLDAGRVEGPPAELKASVGGQRLLITLADESDAEAAAKALAPFATTPVIPTGTGPLIEAPVIASDGLATEVVRSLDAAGVKVSEISVRSASLDDVFLTLTGHGAEDKTAKTRQTAKETVQ